jgi:phosphatidylserine/phosphatidylglycerophosphate/cardiolipin synthase-like enzyme
MKTTLAVYGNGDDALLMWTVDKLDDQCVGFAIQRQLRRNGKQGDAEYLGNWSPAGPGDHQNAVFQPSDAWPFRMFSWTDHTVDAGDVASYRIVPVIPGAPAARVDLASDWSPKLSIGVARGAKFVPAFNRGFVISQFATRYLDEKYPGLTRPQALKKFKDNISAVDEDRFRAFLSGQIRATLLGLLADVTANGGHLYAALFELSDHELIKALVKLGPRAHVVLANGSISVKGKGKGKNKETTEQARKRDENEDARKTLLKAGVDVEQANRFVSPQSLSHNKFAVFTNAARNATAVWTGSTNWSPTGLCTQSNNGLMVKVPEVAGAYLEQWKALRAAGSDHPTSLTKANGTPAVVGNTSVHFTRAPGRTDLAELQSIVMGAKEGVLFLMFQPGGSGVLADVRALAKAKPKLLVRGVVSTLPNGTEDEKTGKTATLKVSLVGGKAATPESATVDVVQPRSFDHVAAGWAAETTRQQFLSNVGFAIIHSKVLVVDPFSENPVVVTGSHNFSLSASGSNDENFLVVRGDRALAEAYAVNIESAWRHYAGRMPNPHARLAGTSYLQALLDDQRRQQAFWGL